MVYILFTSATKCKWINFVWFIECIVWRVHIKWQLVAYGDLNCYWFKHNALSDLCEICGSVNLIEQPTCFKGDYPFLVDVFLITNRNVFLMYVTLTWELVIFIIVYVCHQNCLRRHILSTRSHIRAWNIFLKMLFRMMMSISPSIYAIYLTIMVMCTGCMINYSCQYGTHMLPLKLKLWTRRFHTWNPTLRRAINPRSMWHKQMF